MCLRACTHWQRALHAQKIPLEHTRVWAVRSTNLMGELPRSKSPMSKGDLWNSRSRDQLRYYGACARHTLRVAAHRILRGHRVRNLRSTGHRTAQAFSGCIRADFVCALIQRGELSPRGIMYAVGVGAGGTRIERARPSLRVRGLGEADPC